MAGNAVIGALRVVLGADSAALDKGLKEASSNLAAFGTSVAKAGLAAGAAFAAAGIAAGIAVKGIIDQADKLGKMSQKVGIPVEELSALRVAAELSDVSMESLAKSVGKLSKAMVEAAAKPTSEAANAFKALGVNVTDSSGKLKSSSDVMSDIAGKFEGLKDGAGKTAVSMALFGKAGAEMIPLLNQGKKGIEDAKKEAVELGVVLSKDTTDAAQEFNDNLKRMQFVTEGITTQIASAMLPSLKNLSANMVRVAKDTESWKSVGVAIGDVLVWVFNTTERLSVAWRRLGVEWQLFTAALATVPFTDASKKAWAEFAAAGNETKETLEKLGIVQQTAHLADAFGDTGKKAAEAAPKLKEFNYAVMGGKNALDNFISSQQKAIAGQVADATTSGQLVGSKEALRIVMQGYAVAAENSVKVTNALRNSLLSLSTQAADAAMTLRGAQITQENMTPLQLYVDKMTELNLLLNNNKISQETFNAAVGRLAAPQLAQMTTEFANLGAQIDGVAAGGISRMVSGMSSVVMGTKKGAEALKEFGLAFAQMIVEMTIKMTIALPIAIALKAALASFTGGLSTVFGFSEGGMAGAGMSADAANPSMFASGGAIGGGTVVGPGTGTSDSIFARLSKGEYVINAASAREFRPMLDAINSGSLDPSDLVDRSGGRRDDGGGGRGFTTINLNIAGREDRDHFARIIDGINGAVSDGYRLNVAPA